MIGPIDVHQELYIIESTQPLPEGFHVEGNHTDIEEVRDEYLMYFSEANHSNGLFWSAQIIPGLTLIERDGAHERRETRLREIMVYLRSKDMK